MQAAYVWAPSRQRFLCFGISPPGLTSRSSLAPLPFQVLVTKAPQLMGVVQVASTGLTAANFVKCWLPPTSAEPTAELARDSRSIVWLSRAEVLRRAMTGLMDDPRTPWAAHPSVWAPSVVVGEGGATHYR